VNNRYIEAGKVGKTEEYMNPNWRRNVIIFDTDEKELEFHTGVLDEEEDVQLQILATKAIENLGEVGISRLIKLMKKKSEYKNYQIIIRHVLDGRIY
jgi:hypothetical protein